MEWLNSTGWTSYWYWYSLHITKLHGVLWKRNILSKTTQPQEKKVSEQEWTRDFLRLWPIPWKCSQFAPFENEENEDDPLLLGHPGNLLKGELWNLQVANCSCHQAHSGAYHSQGPAKIGFEWRFPSVSHGFSAGVHFPMMKPPSVRYTPRVTNIGSPKK